MGAAVIGEGSETETAAGGGTAKGAGDGAAALKVRVGWIGVCTGAGATAEGTLPG